MKYIVFSPIISANASPPSRAAWIEIKIQLFNNINIDVAAFTGGVD